MDIMMPDMDGLEALRELKKADVTKSIPVIVITANGHHHRAQGIGRLRRGGVSDEAFQPHAIADGNRAAGAARHG